MKIRMLISERGSIDGIRSTAYAEGQEYDLTDSPGARSLAAAFVGAGMAEEVRALSPTAPVAATHSEPASEPDQAVVSSAKPGKRQK